LAAELGCDQTTISRMESGVRRIGAEDLYAWAEAVGKPLDAAGCIAAVIWRDAAGRPPSLWSGVDRDLT
jgi:transcriptional regulator with XRE-family HTH domain